MNIAQIIDENLLPPHGNRKGLSYGQLAVLLLTYIVSEADHRLCCVEKWVNDHHQSLSAITGWNIGEKDATDDRCGDLLKTIGISDEQTIPSMETSLSKHLIRAYELPTEKARSDTTSFSVYHQPSENQEDSSIIKFGYSKDKRGDLVQYRQMLGTLDPCGMPLVSATLAGNKTDESDYLPTWRQMKEIIGHSNFLYLGDSKASTYQNRAKINKEGGIYCFPLAMTQPRPKLLSDWVKNSVTETIKFYRDNDEQVLQKKVEDILKTHRVSKYIEYEITKKISYDKVYIGHGSRSQSSSYKRVRKTTLQLNYQRIEAEIEEAETLAGWRLYVTNASPERLTLIEAIESYKEQWQPEHGFHRFKKGRLSALPIYFRDEDKIRGLMFLLTIALRVFTLMEFVVRRQLHESQSSLAGLYNGNPKRSTNRPTAEKMLRGFCNITL